MTSRSAHRTFLLVCTVLLLFMATGLHAQSPSTMQPGLIDPHSPGRVFDGVGAISGGGGNSRLLIDYPEPQRSQILDFLFKPHYGANIQILKVEIGSDMDSTDGAESSHMHTASDEDYHRGYEWWLMEQAKARNPNIKLAALAWGAPHWVGDGNYWSKDMIDYTIRWLKHAQSDHHLTIDYLGGRNERGYQLDWYKQLKPALRAAGLGSIKVIASDDWDKKSAWNIGLDMKKDPAINDAIDIIGTHGPGYDSGYAPPDVIALKKPLWDSESHFDEKQPYFQVARNVNRNYVAGKVTATIYWPIVSAMYDNLPYDNIGFIKCNQPWSGHYELKPSLWVLAQTTQFTAPGWRYMDTASGWIDADTTAGHGSFVALQSPNGKDFSIVIETTGAKEPATVAFKVAGFPQTILHLWSTDPSSDDSNNWFVHQTDVPVVDGNVSLPVEPGHVYTLTTTDGQQRGATVVPPSAPLALPFADNFDSYTPGKLARYFSDMYGAFETAPCAGGRAGGCLRQVVTAEPTFWKKTNQRPFTIVGNLDWTDYRVSTDVLFEQPGAVDLIGHLTGMNDPDVPNSYVLRLTDKGDWSVILTSSSRDDAVELERPVVLWSGHIDPPGLNTWHKLSMEFNGQKIGIAIDGKLLTTLDDNSYAKGMIGLGTDGYIQAQFDNVKVEPLNATNVAK
jgi:hypothetical protein